MFKVYNKLIIEIHNLEVVFFLNHDWYKTTQSRRRYKVEITQPQAIKTRSR